MARKKYLIVGAAATLAAGLGALSLQALADPSVPTHTPAPQTSAQQTSPAESMKLTQDELDIVRNIAVNASDNIQDAQVVAAKATLEDYFEAFAPDIEGAARQDAESTPVLIVSVIGEAPDVVRRGPAGAPKAEVTGQVIVVDLNGEVVSRTLVERDTSGEPDTKTNNPPLVEIDLKLTAFNPVQIPVR